MKNKRIVSIVRAAEADLVLYGFLHCLLERHFLDSKEVHLCSRRRQGCEKGRVVVAHSQPSMHGGRKLVCTPALEILTVVVITFDDALQLRTPGPIEFLIISIVAVGQAVTCGGVRPNVVEVRV